MRAALIVLDSVGIGAAPDAHLYGDEGADTVGHIAEACMRGAADDGQRSGPLAVPNLVRWGLGEACRLATGRVPPGLDFAGPLIASFGAARERSEGKDTPSGHWELAGVPVPFAWGYFPTTVPCFPADLIEALCAKAELPGILGNEHASGTAIIAEHGAEHMQSKQPICYTSADSVFQIAAHEDAFGLDRLYAVCEIARKLVDSLNIGRVIARPFTGSPETGFTRTANRRDYAVPPPSPTILDQATQAGRDVVTIGKIDDIFAHRGTGRVLKDAGNAALFERMLEAFVSLRDGGLLFANFVDFDTAYGHRRDVSGYARALEDFDRALPRLLTYVKNSDLVIITADHGCDPTWRGTDHTREQVPVLAYKPGAALDCIGIRHSFADVGATIASHLRLAATGAGTPF